MDAPAALDAAPLSLATARTGLCNQAPFRTVAPAGVDVRPPAQTNASTGAGARRLSRTDTRTGPSGERLFLMVSPAVGGAQPLARTDERRPSTNLLRR